MTSENTVPFLPRANRMVNVCETRRKRQSPLYNAVFRNPYRPKVILRINIAIVSTVLAILRCSMIRARICCAVVSDWCTMSSIFSS